MTTRDNTKVQSVHVEPLRGIYLSKKIILTNKYAINMKLGLDNF